MSFMVIENEDLMRGMCSFGSPTAHASSLSCDGYTQNEREKKEGKRKEEGTQGREEGGREGGASKEGGRR